MASEIRPDGARLERFIAYLREQGPRHTFMSVVAYAQRALGAGARLGEAGPVAEETVFFRHDPSLAFSASDLRSVELMRSARDSNVPFGGQRQKLELVWTFLGLSGVASPLATYFANEVLSGETASKYELRDFFDFFHHRLYSLLYSACSKYDWPDSFVTSGDDRWSRRVLMLCGHLSADVTPSSLPKWLMLRLAPILARRHAGATLLTVALENVLDHEIPGVSVQVHQFQLSWLRLQSCDRSRLGRKNPHGLGQGASVGQSVPTRRDRVRIVVGPVTEDVYRSVMAQPSFLELVKATAALVCGRVLEYDVDALIDRSSVRTCYLSSASPRRLGRDCWMGRLKHDVVVRLVTRGHFELK